MKYCDTFLLRYNHWIDEFDPTLHTKFNIQLEIRLQKNATLASFLFLFFRSRIYEIHAKYSCIYWLYANVWPKHIHKNAKLHWGIRKGLPWGNGIHERVIGIFPRKRSRSPNTPPDRASNVERWLVAVAHVRVCWVAFISSNMLQATEHGGEQ